MANLVELQIDCLTYGGRGVGRIDGKAVFVPAVIPGERVRCRITRDKKRYSEAELVEILEPSPDRRQPPCRFFPECGGCQWQHLPYALQLRWKQQIFRDALVRATGCADELLQPVLAAPEQTGYRCRAQIKCRMTDGGLVAGFFRTGSHYIVDADRCQVLDPLIPPLLDRFRASIATLKEADKVPQVDFCVDSNGQVALVVHFIGSDVAAIKRSLRRLAADAGVAVYLQSGRKSTLQPVVAAQQAIRPEADGELVLGFPAGGFIQINLAQNRRLVAEVVRQAVRGGEERILDLYSGIGNFSLPLARRCREVVGVEEYAPGVAAAEQNARSNDLTNVRFIVGRSEQVIAGLATGPRFDVVVLDPPRSGAYKTLKSLLQLRPQRIVYVSCDPSTLARDLVPLLHNGYELLSAQPLDMFPQTWHIEGIAVLQRNGSDGD